MQLLYGEDANVAAWVAARIPHMAGEAFGPCSAIGVVSEARRGNAKALRVTFSKSLASRRHRLNQAKVRSTTQRCGRTSKPLA